MGVASPLPADSALNGSGGFELGAEDAGFEAADAAVGNAEMLVKDDTN